MKTLLLPPAGTVPAFLISGPLDGAVLHMSPHSAGEFTVTNSGIGTTYAAAEPLQGGGRNWRTIEPQQWTIRFKTGLAKCPIVEAVVTARRWAAAVGRAEETVSAFGVLPVDLSYPVLVQVCPISQS